MDNTISYAINFMPIIISSIFLVLVSFMKKTKNNNKNWWLALTVIIWLGAWLWTIKHFGVFF